MSNDDDATTRITEFDGLNPAGLFARALDTPRNAGSPPGWTPPTAEELQHGLPQYGITAMIGHGGMGAVYRGWQKSLDRHVAIKILPAEVSQRDPGFAERFRREAKAMARLSHPGIVAVHDAGETSGGLLYFVMDFIEGTDVQQMVAAQGRLPPEEALKITAKICDALTYAHGKGVIHRDIKPSNVMVDAEGNVKVADFGLAKFTAADASLLTASDAMMGTPSFMAPETLNGAAQVDHRADLYAVGVMLYQMLTGKLPRGRFEPPSTAVPGLDKRLDRVVDRALQSEPGARYSTAVELRTAIDPVLTSSIAKRRATAAAPARRRKRPLLIGTFAAAVLVIGGTALWKRPPAVASVNPARDSVLFAATKESPYINTLGMKFVPVPITGGPTGGQRVLFSIWETRAQDYEVFVKDTNRANWNPPLFEQGPTHPAVNVSWDDAVAFCAWLTERERKAGRLDPAKLYRLPGDHEWSCAVGLGELENAADLPVENDKKNADIFPWGSAWPPTEGAGNYSGEELQSEASAIGAAVLTGYRDGFMHTAPVGSFMSNRLGLYDLGGNVWEWCADWLDSKMQNKVVRGECWMASDRQWMQSAGRGQGTDPTARSGAHGFRVVLAAAAPVIGPTGAVSGKEAGVLLKTDFTASDPKAQNSHAELIGSQLHLWGFGSWQYIPHQHFTNVAQRVFFTWRENTRTVKLAHFHASESHHYAKLFNKSLTHATLVEIGLFQGNDRGLKSFPIEPPLKAGDPVVFQFATVGSLHTAWLNGRLVGSVTDDTGLGAGDAKLVAEEGIFDRYEYLPLDGLTETGALNLLGITPP